MVCHGGKNIYLHRGVIWYAYRLRSFQKGRLVCADRLFVHTVGLLIGLCVSFKTSNKFTVRWPAIAFFKLGLQICLWHVPSHQHTHVVGRLTSICWWPGAACQAYMEVPKYQINFMLCPQIICIYIYIKETSCKFSYIYIYINGHGMNIALECRLSYLSLSLT